MHVFADNTTRGSALVAAESAQARRPLCDALSGEGHRVIEARDAAEAFELCRRYVPDLVVLDPLAARTGALERIRADGELHDVPVICLAPAAAPHEQVDRVRAALRSA